LKKLGRIKMNVWEVMIIEENYDDENEETRYETLFGPELIITYAKSDALKIAAVKSKIPDNKIPEVEFFIRKFTNERNCDN